MFQHFGLPLQIDFGVDVGRVDGNVMFRCSAIMFRLDWQDKLCFAEQPIDREVSGTDSGDS